MMAYRLMVKCARYGAPLCPRQPTDVWIGALSFRMYRRV
jgi:hypothetical protein